MQIRLSSLALNPPKCIYSIFVPRSNPTVTLAVVHTEFGILILCGSDARFEALGLNRNHRLSAT